MEAEEAMKRKPKWIQGALDGAKGHPFADKAKRARKDDHDTVAHGR